MFDCLNKLNDPVEHDVQFVKTLKQGKINFKCFYFKDCFF